MVWSVLICIFMYISISFFNINYALVVCSDNECENIPSKLNDFDDISNNF